MYKEFFGLKEPPFNLTPDPRFFYMSRRHQEALASLVYGIKERKGFILLTGEIGAGKTTLSRTFLSQLNHEATNVALVLNSYLTDVELLQTINGEFGIPSGAASKKELIDELNRFLLAEADKGKTTVILIDEAQNLAPAVLEQVRMLSNLETESAKLLQIVLMGQPELGRILAKPELEQLNQRIMVRCHIGPLDKQEIYHYIRHRLQVAGARINVAVNPAALNRIYHYSKGIPRRINVLMDRALLAAYVAGQFWIDSGTIATAERELRQMGVRQSGRRVWLPWLSPSAVFAFFAGCILIGLVGAAFYMGLNLERFLPPPANALTGGAPLPSATPPLQAMALPPPTMSASGEVSPAPKPIASRTVAPTLRPTPAPTPTSEPLLTLEMLPSSATLSRFEPWAYDEEGIARVADPDFAEMASLLTISKLWRLPVQTDSFQSYDKATLLGINLQNIFDGPEISLRSFSTTATLAEAIRFDMPLLLSIEDPSHRLSPSLVLLRMVRSQCVLGDPRLGRADLSLPVLQPLVRGIRVIYRDPDHLAAFVPGASPEKDAILTAFFTEKGFREGAGTNSSAESMGQALRRFQEACGLAPTSRMDGATAAHIAARRLPFRPRLLPPGEAAFPKAAPSSGASAGAVPNSGVNLRGGPADR